MMQSSTAFAKSKRLLKADAFRNVFNVPSKKFHSEHFLLFIKNNNLTHARLGLAITKKKIKTAVQRNTIKRYTRELFRLQQHNLPAVDCVLIVKKTHNENRITSTEIANLFDRLEQFSSPKT